MHGWSRSAGVGLVAAAVAASSAACAGAGDLSLVNESGAAVTVSIGDDEHEIPPTGGTVLLDHGCTSGDVTVELAAGRVVVLDGPVCSDERVVIRDDGVELEPASDHDS